MEYQKTKKLNDQFFNDLDKSSSIETKIRVTKRYNQGSLNRKTRSIFEKKANDGWIEGNPYGDETDAEQAFRKRAAYIM